MRNIMQKYNAIHWIKRNCVNPSIDVCQYEIVTYVTYITFLARLLILIKKGGLLQLKFGVVGVGVNIYLWAR